jgi:hypothetical protein
MADFDQRSLDDDDFRISPHPAPRPKSNWPATRVLGWVIAIGGLSVVLNVVSVVVVYVAMARMDATYSANEQPRSDVQQLRSDVDDLKDATANLTTAVKALADQHTVKSAKGN